ncbi:MAG: hypothetical protein A2Y76_00230 [Planctomycetes bacterium RBG_13_60_9]|nr:MAG: hypothetical protein A2Y76_00230 [Planctomycetes bacterium RBG_13_60_9]
MVMPGVGGTWGCVVFLWVVVQGLSMAAWGAYGGGRGTAEDPYLIFTADQVDALGTRPGDWDKYFLLMADIDLAGSGEPEFHRIGTPEDGPFTGTFDGNCRTISNLHWSSEWKRYLGLFGLVDGEQARIANLTLVDPNIAVEVGQYIGALAGFIRTGTIINCHVRGGTIRGETCVGGLVGTKENATVSDCTADVTVQGVTRVGGLVGHSYWGLTARCDAAGTATGGSEMEHYGVGGLIGHSQYGVVSECHAKCTTRCNRYVGGLIGVNHLTAVRRSWAEGVARGEQCIGGLIGQNEGGVITDCYALTDVHGLAFLGGLVGYNTSDCQCTTHTSGLVDRCFAAGPVGGMADIGGVVGINNQGETAHSFWDVQTTACARSAGGDPKTTAQMQDVSTFLAAGWDFVDEKANGIEDIWCMSVLTGYPRLAWQVETTDVDVDAADPNEPQTPPVHE